MEKLYFDANAISNGEEIIYFDKAKTPWFSTFEIICAVVLGLAIIAFDGFIFGAEVMSSIIEKSPKSKVLLLICCIAVHFAPLCAWAFYIMVKRLKNNNLYYLITDKRFLVIENTPCFSIKSIDMVLCRQLVLKKNVLVIRTETENIKLYGVNLSETGKQKLNEVCPLSKGVI